MKIHPPTGRSKPFVRDRRQPAKLLEITNTREQLEGDARDTSSLFKSENESSPRQSRQSRRNASICKRFCAPWRIRPAARGTAFERGTKRADNEQPFQRQPDTASPGHVNHQSRGRYSQCQFDAGRKCDHCGLSPNCTNCGQGRGAGQSYCILISHQRVSRKPPNA